MARDDNDSDSDNGGERTDGQTVTREEIEQYEEEHGEPHPVFSVDHRPERRTFTLEGCLWGECGVKDDINKVVVCDEEGERHESQVCPEHLQALKSRSGVEVEVLRE